MYFWGTLGGLCAMLNGRWKDVQAVETRLRSSGKCMMGESDQEGVQR